MNPLWGEHIKRALACLYDTSEVTDEERAKHAQLVHEQIWRDQRAKSAQADAFDEAGEK